MLPLPKHAVVAELEDGGTIVPALTVKAPPLQGRREGWIPRSLADFGGGGAFPEVHVAQYPLNMGRQGRHSTQVLALTTDASGKARHDILASVGKREGKVVHSDLDALKPKKNQRGGVVQTL